MVFTSLERKWHYPEGDSEVVAVFEHTSQQQQQHQQSTNDDDDEVEPSSKQKNDESVKRVKLIIFQICHLSAWAVLGSTLRVYLGRIFGEDCEFPNVNDFLTPFSKRICITASGLSRQTGGALFVDLPANMIGSFVLGTLSPTTLMDDGPPLPWLRKCHPLQQLDALHVAIKVGFCGSLTTFSSWNSQMVVMLDGTQTELGPQVAPALFGYLLGVLVPVASFLFGGHVRSWFRNSVHPVSKPESDNLNSLEQQQQQQQQQVDNPNLDEDEDDDDVSTVSRRSRRRQLLELLICGRVLPCLLAIGLVLAFVLGDALLHITFYRTAWLSMILSPPGALLRWQLSKLNNPRKIQQQQRFPWIPWGTLLVNIVGSVLSALLLALLTRFELETSWAGPIISAARIGFCGSLTTVSTFCREVVDLSRRHPTPAKSYLYALISLIPAMLLSLLVYSPIVRH